MISFASGSSLKQQKNKSLNLYHRTRFHGKLLVLTEDWTFFASRVPVVKVSYKVIIQT